MRLGQVIGRVTLSVQDPGFTGARWLVVSPLDAVQLAGGPRVPLAKASSMVVYDDLGASEGDTIGFVEGGEASMPFLKPTPVDAYNFAIINTIDYQPPASPAPSAL